ncbi:unnamed protein product [Owenia fusiformis]|uniref:Mitochondrial basic amino acids transporter n=1 Tax=Owenia fusiformis TaxID=6347 RepID=A0A8J1U6G2_OWEFU|nr:unnamed protein product [Owenia fusiformis]
MASDFVAGCIGGCAGVLAGHPFDTVKVRLQCQSGSLRYAGTIHCIHSIIKQESAKGMMRGITCPLIGLSFINTIVFGVQGNMQRRMKQPDSLKSHWISGCSAGLVQTVISSPMELVKTRMQIQGSGKQFSDKSSRFYKSSIHCIEHIYKNEGLKGLRRGFLMTALRDCPGFGIYFVSYEFFCGLFASKEAGGSQGEMGLPGFLLAGGLAGVVSFIPMYPTDVIKSRLQADGMTQTLYKGPIDCAKKSYKAGGLKVFYKGLTPTLVRAFPVNAVTFAVVSIVKQYLDSGKKEQKDREVRHWFIHETLPEVMEGVMHI